MKRFAVRGIVCALTGVLSACGALEQRKEVKGAAVQTRAEASTYVENLKASDQERGAVVRELAGMWFGGKTIKVSREAELPVVFSQNIRFEFPDRPVITTIADRLSKVIRIPVKVSPDAMVPMEQFALQRMGASGSAKGTGQQGVSATAPGVPGTLVNPPVGGVQVPSLTGGIGGAAPSSQGVQQLMPASTARPFILDVSSPYQGTLTDLLEQISARYGVGWDFQDGSIIISRIVTRTYQIASILDANSNNNQISQNSSAGSSSGSTGSIGGSAGQSSSNSNLSSQITSKLDVVEGIKESVTAALTPNVGKFSISSFGVVTVTDTREVQDQVRTLIDAENKAMSRQIRMRMTIVEVKSTIKNDMGVDWGWVINQATRKWNVNFAAATGVPGGSTGTSSLGFIRNGSSSASQTSGFLRALGEVGDVTIRKDETFMVMNNRPVSMALAENLIYPARSTPAYSGSSSIVGSNSGQAGVEPGQLTTGVFMNLRASVLPNGSVVVQLSYDSSRRGKIETIESNGVKLQYPQSSKAQYQIYGSIPNNHTEVFMNSQGSLQDGLERSMDSNVSPLLGGGIYNNSERSAVFILMTPTIIEGVI